MIALYGVGAAADGMLLRLLLNRRKVKRTGSVDNLALLFCFAL